MSGKGPFLLALTGSIGMGKSTTAKIFADEGVPVWDADAAVHRLYSKGGAGVEAVRRLCPEAIRGGEVDRAALRRWVMQQPGALSRLEQVIHPLVAADREEFIRSSTAPVLVFDIPLLFEKGSEGEFDAVVVVSAPEEEQRRRVLARPGMDQETLEKILARQMPDAEKRRRADHVIITDTPENAVRQVRSILAGIRKEMTDARDRA